MRCRECYSEYSRITPFYQPERCLRDHAQYICASCGRAICMDEDESMKARCFMLFKSFEIAMLYVRAAEILTGNVCGIYAIDEIDTARRIGYKIFPSQEELGKYFQQNTDKRCTSKTPLFISERYVPATKQQIFKLAEPQVLKYLEGYQADSAIRFELLTK